MALAGVGYSILLTSDQILDLFNVFLQKRCGGFSMLVHLRFHTTVKWAYANDQNRCAPLIGYQKLQMSSTKIKGEEMACHTMGTAYIVSRTMVSII
jgi:hypothetical protein